MGSLEEWKMNRLLVWGTGNIAEQVLRNSLNGHIIGFIETVKRRKEYKGRPVFDLNDMPKDYDYIIVANAYVSEIYELCVEKELDLDKLIFVKGGISKLGCQELSIISEILGEKNYSDFCNEMQQINESFYCRDLQVYQTLNKRERFKAEEKYLWPILSDKYACAGTLGNYFFQDLWAAKKIIKSGVKQHFDIGSRLDGFIAHLLAAEIEVTMIDVREFPGAVEDLYTIVDDATSLHQVADESIESMSALCSLEHFGLGRYGDPIDPEACFKCFSNIQRKLKKGGKLYLSLPIGKERVEFNAHRVFYASTVIECFSELTLKEFSCTSQGEMEYHVEPHKYDEDRHNGEYRYGLFEFVK